MTDSYCIDTNIVIDLRNRYPRDVYPSVWGSVEALINDGRAVTPKQVLIELERVDDECGPWAKSIPGFVVEATPGEIALVTTISARHPGWVQEQKNEADPWVVAHAAIHSRLVVTDERARGAGVADHNLTIPNVASEHDVSTLSFNDLARREGWTF